MVEGSKNIRRLVMYKQNFCVCIKDAKRNPLQEQRGVVTLPFDSEYYISLQNKHRGKRAVVNVKIDGKDAADIVLNADSKLDLERFLTGENLLNGSRFKFVSLKDDDVQDPGDSNNGNIDVSVRFEKSIKDIKVWPYQPIWIVPKTTPWTWYYPPYEYHYFHQQPYIGDPLPGQQPIITCSHTLDNQSCGTVTNAASSNVTLTCNNISSEPSVKSDQLGATVKGSESNQAFSFTTIEDLEDEVITFNFRLIAPLELAVPPNQFTQAKNLKLEVDDVFCVNCGKILKKAYKFCSNCGVKQPVS